MKIYLIHLELNNDSKTLSAVSGILNSYNGIRYQKEAWMVSTSETAGTIKDKLNPILGRNEYVMVTKLDDDFSMKQPQSIENWLRRNLHSYL